MESVSLNEKANNLELAQDEEIVKSWKFATQIFPTNKRGTEVALDSSLTITNKRVVLEQNTLGETFTGKQRDEIAVEAIKGVQTGYSSNTPKNPFVVGIILLIFGLATLLLGFFADFDGETIPKILFIVLGLFFFIPALAILFKKQNANMFFRLNILSNIFPSGAINISTIVSTNPALTAKQDLFKISPSLNLVFFDEKMAKEIVCTIGKLIIAK